MTLILPLLVSNGSWGSYLPVCEGSPVVANVKRNDGADTILFMYSLRWKTCWGDITYANGESYVGEFWKNQPHGYGTSKFEDGAQYSGRYKLGAFHGQGTLIFPDGAKFEGIWREGEFLYENIVISNEDREFCQEIGFTVNTPEYDKCVQKSAEKD